MLNKKIEEAINDQINYEFYSAYLYLSMAGYLKGEELEGFSNWMMVQYQEEISHTMKFFNYIHDRGGKVVFKDVKAPPSSWASVLDVFNETLEHEKTVTDSINNLIDLAIKEKDHATCNFLQWYIKEQVEEEASVSSIIGKIKLVQDSNEGLYHLDKELAGRIFVDTTQE